jgi:hypothetical protein
VSTGHSQGDGAGVSRAARPGWLQHRAAQLTGLLQYKPEPQIALVMIRTLASAGSRIGGLIHRDLPEAVPGQQLSFLLSGPYPAAVGLALAGCSYLTVALWTSSSSG